MTESLFLNQTEVQHLTGRHRRMAQVRVLKHMGIEHKLRPDGSVIITRSHIEHIFSGDTKRQSLAPAEPNWGALNAKTAQANK